MRRADWTPTTRFSMDSVVVDPLLAKLQELADLPKGWEFGRGIPVKQDVIRTAQKYTGFLAPSSALKLTRSHGRTGH